MSRVGELEFYTNIDTYVSKDGLSVFGVTIIDVDGVEYVYVNERRSDGERILAYVTDGNKAVGIINRDGNIYHIYQINPDLVNFYNATLSKGVDHISLSLFSGAVVRNSLVINGGLRINDLMA